MTIFTFEVGKNYPIFEDIAYCKEKNYCLIHTETFIKFVEKRIEVYDRIQITILFSTLGINMLNINNSIIQINKYEKK
jgi:hypothetical protein